MKTEEPSATGNFNSKSFLLGPKKGEKKNRTFSNYSRISTTETRPRNRMRPDLEHSSATWEKNLLCQ